MDKMTKINCSVNNCVFNKQRYCDANEITVNCDKCVKPEQTHQTECASFKNRV